MELLYSSLSSLLILGVCCNIAVVAELIIPSAIIGAVKIYIADIEISSGETMSRYSLMKKVLEKFSDKPKKTKIIGSIDYVTKFQIVGWIKLNSSNETITVNVFVDGEKIASAYEAKLDRPDVKESGFGHGRYGFEIPLTLAKFAKPPGETLDVVVSSTDGKYQLTKQVSLDEANSIRNDITESHSEVTIRKVLSELSSGKAFSGGEEHANYRVQLEILSDNRLRAWSVNTSRPEAIFELDVLLDGCYLMNVKNDMRRDDLRRKSISGGKGGIDIPLPFQFLNLGSHEVSLVAPNGEKASRELVVDSSILTSSWSAADRLKNLTVIVPVYNAFDDVVKCIENLLLYTPAEVSFLVINDSSTDHRIKEFLDPCSDHPQFTIIHNQENLGFTKTVNKGINLAGESDVILLNSDARVTPAWLHGIISATKSRRKVATVTAMSDRAGAFSAPTMGNGNELPNEITEEQFARAFRRSSLGIYPEVPTGNGFCMYVSRAAINDIGLFDDQAFPRGYGEENDFCMRARHAGWVNLIDDRTYVFHDRSKSFGDSKTDLMRRGREVIDARYPDYKFATQVFSKNSDIALARSRARVALKTLLPNFSYQKKPKVIYVVSTRTGGTPQTNKDLIRGLDGAVEAFILSCNRQEILLEDACGNIMEKHRLEAKITPLTHMSQEYDNVVSLWLIKYLPDILHVRHIAWHSLNLISAAKNLGAKIVFSFHDYYMLTPTVKMLDDDNVFEGKNFIPGNQINRQDLWPDVSQPDPTSEWLDFWQNRSQKILEQCDAYVTTSASAKQRIQGHFFKLTDRRFDVIPHGRDFHEFSSLGKSSAVEDFRVLRILVPGNIDVSKGLNVIRELIGKDAEHLLEFHILGSIAPDNDLPQRGIVYHGRYEREHFASQAASIKPHIGAIFSIWDETYCHTLTELLSVGLPVVALNFPTVASRLNMHRAGWIFNVDDVGALYDGLKGIAKNRVELINKIDNVEKWQESEGSYNTIRFMALKYFELYRCVLKKQVVNSVNAPTKPIVAVLCPQEDNLERANPSTHIRVWERTVNDANRPINYLRVTAASLRSLCQNRLIAGAIIQRDAVKIEDIESTLNSMRENNIPYLYEIDDNLLSVPSSKDPNGVYSSYRPYLELLIKNAFGVSTTTFELSSVLSRYNNNVHIFENMVSRRIWPNLPHQRVQDGVFRILYLGGSSHIEDLEAVLPPLEKLATKYSNLEFEVIGLKNSGFHYPEFVKIINVPDQVKHYPEFARWMSARASRYDLAIAPLVDNEFNQHKSPLKVLDSGVLGLPVVASDNKVFRSLRSDIPSVRFCKNTQHAWYEGIDAAINDINSKRMIGAELQEWIYHNYDINSSTHQFDLLVAKMIKAHSLKFYI